MAVIGAVAGHANVTQVLDVFRGANNAAVRKHGHDRLPCWGSGSSLGCGYRPSSACLKLVTTLRHSEVSEVRNRFAVESRSDCRVHAHLPDEREIQSSSSAPGSPQIPSITRNR